MSSVTDTSLKHLFLFIAAWFIQKKSICILGSGNADILDMQNAHKPTSNIRYVSVVGPQSY